MSMRGNNFSATPENASVLAFADRSYPDGTAGIANPLDVRGFLRILR